MLYLGEQVATNGSQVVPVGNNASINSQITVWYLDITNFTIDHGNPLECNPGKIFIGEIEIEGEFANLPKPNLDLQISTSNDYIFIDHSDLSLQNVQLINALGTSCFQTKDNSSNPIRIDIRQLPSGIYFLSAVTENNVLLQKKIAL